jgi:N-acetylglucosaminyldiphosphoundecaprenol N-acetyl-beta-D-mannosaminyltransferase
VCARESINYRNAIEHATLSVPDGMPLVWLLRLKGHNIRHRVYGPDLMLLLCEEAANRGWRCFLYGGAPGVPEQLKEVLEKRFPGLQIVGTYSPPFRPLTVEEDEAVCAMINAAKPDIVWVGLGSPKQDIWMYEHREKLDVSVMHGVGAAFDFLTGRVKQAPRCMMNAGLEWLFRLFQEPKRLWKRYTLTNAKFIYYLLKSILLKS